MRVATRNRRELLEVGFVGVERRLESNCSLPCKDVSLTTARKVRSAGRGKFSHSLDLFGLGGGEESCATRRAPAHPTSTGTRGIEDRRRPPDRRQAPFYSFHGCGCCMRRCSRVHAHDKCVDGLVAKDFRPGVRGSAGGRPSSFTDQRTCFEWGFRASRV